MRGKPSGEEKGRMMPIFLKRFIGDISVILLCFRCSKCLEYDVVCMAIGDIGQAKNAQRLDNPFLLRFDCCSFTRLTGNVNVGGQK